MRYNLNTYESPPSFEKTGARNFVIYAAYPILFVGLAAGTGARCIDPGSSFQTSAISLVETPVPLTFINRRRTEAAHIQLISQVRTGLRLNTSALASILQVSRTAIYDWLQGAIPKPDMMNRLSSLAEYAERVRALGISRFETLHHLPLVNGKNFLAILTEDRDVDKGIEILAERADARISRVNQRAERSRGTVQNPSTEERFVDLANLE
jgi:hypothetical protein